MVRTAAERQQRFARLRDFDRTCDAEALACGLLVGVDEAGVGPLAGPVVAAAVILPDDFELPELYDSKQLSESDRLHCEAAIRRHAIHLAVARVTPPTIDSINILNAMLRAHREALRRLEVEPRVVLVDGHRAPRLPRQWTRVRLQTVVRGDSHSMSIAAASILAKTVRDRIMKRLDRRYPEYGFAHNKGYGTADHKQAVRRFGLSPVHRRSFCRWLDDELLLRRQTSLHFE
jgi:ribonuclease HII